MSIQLPWARTGPVLGRGSDDLARICGCRAMLLKKVPQGAWGLMFVRPITRILVK